jgi:alkanesulfonate monooxygenase SsuD/methylene tetrahydromethanopterin reductase-like flavin-dependent oxidoreductase (luciferase family)
MRGCPRGTCFSRTTTLSLGLLVGAVTFRNPAYHAKLTTTLDVLSGGRAIHGVGAAWHEPEHRAYGFDFPPIGERLQRLREALEIARAMFTEAAPSFDGVHYRIEEVRNEPRPLRGDIPVIVGGAGERKTLRLVAQYADASNFGGPPERVKHLVSVIERHCQDVGRDSSELAITVGGVVVIANTHEEARRRRDHHRETSSIPSEMYEDVVIWGAPDEVAAQVAERLEAGATGFLPTLPDPFDLESVELLGRAVSPLLTA